MVQASCDHLAPRSSGSVARSRLRRGYSDFRRGDCLRGAVVRPRGLRGGFVWRGGAMRKAVLLMLSVLFVPVFARAQGLGSIVGTVTDPAGAANAFAKIMAEKGGEGVVPE